MMFYLCAIFFLLYSSLVILNHAEPLKGEAVRKVEKGHHPYAVSIGLKRNDFDQEKLHSCTGVLVSNRFVLTAAHCFNEKTLGGIELIVRSVDLRKGRKYVPSMWITYHQWVENKNITRVNATNDIAMVKLSHRVSKKLARPAKILFESKDNLYDEYVVLAGWGLTNESPDYPARFLHEAQTKVLPNKVCENILYYLSKKKYPISNTYLRTKGEEHVALLAHGDSGGPVMWKNSVVAVSKSVCPKTGVCGLTEDILNDHKFNIHIVIDFYKEFIDDVMANY